MSEPANSPQQRPGPPSAVWLCLGTLAPPFVVETLRAFLGSNFHTLLPRKVYRCAQPSSRELEKVIRSTDSHRRQPPRLLRPESLVSRRMS